MILVLKNGERIVDVYRQNCGYEYKDYRNVWTRSWNTNPQERIYNQEKGFFVIGRWGSGASEPCEKKILVSSVLYLEDTHKWEMPGTQHAPPEFIEEGDMGI